MISLLESFFYVKYIGKYLFSFERAYASDLVKVSWEQNSFLCNKEIVIFFKIELRNSFEPLNVSIQTDSKIRYQLLI